METIFIEYLKYFNFFLLKCSVCHLMYLCLEKYGNTPSKVRHLVVMERKCYYKSDVITILVIFCNSWVSAGKPLLLYNLMSGHHWKLDSHWSGPSLPASDWLVSSHLISVTPSCHHKLLPTAGGCQTPWRTICKVQPALPWSSWPGN